MQSKVSQRLGSLQNHINGHVAVTMSGIKTTFSGAALRDLMGLHPVAAVTDFVKNAADGVVDDIIVGNVNGFADSVKDQAAITRQGRA
jgi:hypothetical protein